MPQKKGFLDPIQDPNQLNNFLATFPVIERVTQRYSGASEMTENEDIAQDVKLGLLVWKKKRPLQVYSLTEWLKIAHQSTRNEIKNYFRKKVHCTVSISDIELEQQLGSHPKEKALTTKLEGNTTMELNLLMSQMWEIIQTQSFFETYALLLKNDELTSYLIFYRGCKFKELAEKLKLTGNELDGIIKQLPLSDGEISTFLQERFQMKATPPAIRKARQRATDQLFAAVNGKRKDKNGKSSGKGQT